MLMSRSDGGNSRGFFGGKGLYIALALCLTLVGVLGYFALAGDEPTEPVVSNTPVVQQPTPDPEPTPTPEPSPAPAPQPQPEPEVQETLEPEDTVEVEELLPRVISPLDGTTVTVFSMTELLYDETMEDWRTHDGLDIRAAEGDAVQTAADGMVESVSNDELLGTTVVIAHDGGYTTRYSSLLPEPPVSPGQSVESGQIIGYVGATAAAEASMGPHLHFAVTRDGELIDPHEYVG